MRKTLFLNPPSFDGFDGGAGARYQARREVRSFWFPTWLAQPAAMVPGSKLVDAPPAGLSLDDIVPMAADFEMAVLHTSTPSFRRDLETIEALKDSNPHLIIGLVGSHVSTLAQASLEASTGIDFVTRGEFDHTIVEVAEGRAFEDVDGLSYRKNGKLYHTRGRPLLENLDGLPHVTDVFARDLVLENYQVGEALWPYLSFYTGRGCKSRCTFCLWPQTIEGHRFRTRSPEHVVAELRKGLDYYPQLREFFFDDDTLTDAIPHVEGIARLIGPMLAERNVSWSCNAKGNVPFETLKVLKENGLRLVTVGFESGNQHILHNIKKGTKVSRYRRFAEDCHKLGIKMHGCFIIGLPGESRETIQQTIEFAKEIDPHTVQVSVTAPYPGTLLYDEAKKEGWLRDQSGQLLMDEGFQVTSLEYPHLSSQEMFDAVDEFYRKFFFRPRKVAGMLGEMFSDWNQMKVRFGEARDFFTYLDRREDRVAES